jgi:hypothetical protein
MENISKFYFAWQLVDQVTPAQTAESIAQARCRANNRKEVVVVDKRLTKCLVERNHISWRYAHKVYYKNNNPECRFSKRLSQSHSAI